MIFGFGFQNKSFQESYNFFGVNYSASVAIFQLICSVLSTLNFLQLLLKDTLPIDMSGPEQFYVFCFKFLQE